MGKERQAVERVIERIYKDRLKRTGRLPDAGEVRSVEEKVKRAAERADRKR